MRKRILLTMITKHKTLPMSQLRGLFSLKTGLTYKKINEYLRELSDANLIIIENDTVRLSGTPGPENN